MRKKVYVNRKVPVTNKIVCDICGRFFDITDPKDFFEGGVLYLEFGYGSKLDTWTDLEGGISTEFDICDNCFENHFSVLKKLLQKRWDDMMVRECEKTDIE